MPELRPRALRHARELFWARQLGVTCAEQFAQVGMELVLSEFEQSTRFVLAHGVTPRFRAMRCKSRRAE
jgi:hypothetical protein